MGLPSFKNENESPPPQVRCASLNFPSGRWMLAANQATGAIVSFSSRSA